MVVSGVELLTISEPLNGSTFGLNEPINLLISNDEGETFINAAVTFASPCGNIVSTIPVGTVQSIYLPCNVVGITTIAARSGATVASSIQIIISPAYNAATGAIGGTITPYDIACGNPCGSRRSTRRSCRSRGCDYYAEGSAEDVQEVAAEQLASE